MSQMTNNLLRLLKETQEAAEQIVYDYGRLEREAIQLAESRQQLQKQLTDITIKCSNLQMGVMRLRQLRDAGAELPAEFGAVLDALITQLAWE